MSWHGRLWIRCLQVVGQLRGFAESSFGEVDVVNISSHDGLARRVRCDEDGKEKYQNYSKRRSALQNVPPEPTLASLANLLES